MGDTKAKKKVILLPEGRLIWHALFERDIFKKDEKSAPGEPKYAVLMTFEPGQVTGEGTIEDDMADEIAAAYGDKVADEWLATPRRVDRISPLKNGDEWVADKLANGKSGYDHAKGKIVLSADSAFNRDGVKGPGGFKVFGPDYQPIFMPQQELIYAGCYGRCAVTLNAYDDYPRKGDRAIKVYLTEFMKTREGERLSTGGGSSLFAPVGAAAPAAEGRRRRVG